MEKYWFEFGDLVFLFKFTGGLQFPAPYRYLLKELMGYDQTQEVYYWEVERTD